MGTTPLWVPLAVALIAVLGTLAGVIFTQVWNSRLDERRWVREAERLREAQAREDRNRTYEHRRAAYVEFLQEWDRVLRLFWDSNRETSPHVGPVFDELEQLWNPIRVYGTNEADDLAFGCLEKLRRWARNPDEGSMADDVIVAGVEYVSQIRKDLGVPDRQPADTMETKPATDQGKRDHGG